MNRVEIKENNVSIARIEERCLNCGVCLKTCNEINNIEKDCINCGQCLLTCPSGALVPKFDYQKVLNILNDTEYTVVAFTSPAVRVAIGDEFGFEPGTFLERKMVGVLKALKFDYVFDTTFGADLTVMEEAYELLDRIKNAKTPLFTSCCPSWVLYMNKYHQDDLDLLSSCKSPISMQSAVIKSYFADMYGIDKNKIITVAMTPCVSKKYERTLYLDTDFVLTTREFAMMIRESNLSFADCAEKDFDSLLGKGSGGGLIFGTSGGVMESTLRTLYYMLNKKKAPDKFYDFVALRGEEDFKTALVDMGSFMIKAAVVNKVSTVKEKYEEFKKYDFVEVMSCPGGCIGGGGQPLVAIKDMKEIRKKRSDSLYNDDQNQLIKESYMNKEIQDAYISYLSKNEVELHYKQDALQKSTKKV